MYGIGSFDDQMEFVRTMWNCTEQHGAPHSHTATHPPPGLHIRGGGGGGTRSRGTSPCAGRATPGCPAGWRSKERRKSTSGGAQAGKYLPRKVVLSMVATKLGEEKDGEGGAGGPPYNTSPGPGQPGRRTQWQALHLVS
eukprot:gene14715-biopygen14209